MSLLMFFLLQVNRGIEHHLPNFRLLSVRSGKLVQICVTEKAKERAEQEGGCDNDMLLLKR